MAALSLNPANILSNAHDFMRRGRFFDAIEALLDVILKSPSHIEAHIDLASCYYVTGQSNLYLEFTKKSNLLFLQYQKLEDETAPRPSIAVVLKLGKLLEETASFHLAQKVYLSNCEVSSSADQIRQVKRVALQLLLSSLGFENGEQDRLYDWALELRDKYPNIVDIQHATVLFQLRRGMYVEALNSFWLGYQIAERDLEEFRQWYLYDVAFEYIRQGFLPDEVARVIQKDKSENLGFFEKVVQQIYLSFKSGLAIRLIDCNLDSVSPLSELLLLDSLLLFIRDEDRPSALLSIHKTLQKVPSESRQILVKLLKNYIRHQKSKRVIWSKQELAIIELFLFDSRQSIETVCRKLYYAELDSAKFDRIKVAISRMNKKLFSQFCVDQVFAIRGENILMRESCKDLIST